MFENDEQLLRELARSCKDSKEKIRYLVLHGISKGHSIRLMSEIFCIDESTIHNWIKKWRENKSVQDDPKSGRPSILSEKEKDKIRRLLKENNPRIYGMNASFWDTKELQMHFKKQNIDISRETLRKYLKQLGARYVKAVIKFPEADIKKQKEFAKRFFSQNKSGSAIILFQDEMSAESSARKGYGWTLKKRLEIKAPQRNRQRVNCFGAVCPDNGDIVQMTSKDAKAPTFIRFLNKIIKKYRGKNVVIYLDNCSVHRSKKVKEFVGKHPNIRLEFMPPYSPDLNPKEQWWNYKRKKLLNNRNFSSPHQLAASISWFTKNTSQAQIMSVCNIEPIQRLME